MELAPRIELDWEKIPGKWNELCRDTRQVRSKAHVVIPPAAGETYLLGSESYTFDELEKAVDSGKLTRKKLKKQKLDFTVESVTIFQKLMLSFSDEVLNALSPTERLSALRFFYGVMQTKPSRKFVPASMEDLTEIYDERNK